MIVKNETEQWVGCTICGEQIELRRKTLQNTETVLLIVEYLEGEHEDCKKYVREPRKAQLSRDFSKRVREELARIERSTRAMA